ncbi:MAG: hypothetical protein WBV82_33530 [Myxococcaceae bacterium]
MKRIIVAPEPAAWLTHLLADSAAMRDTVVFAPWALPKLPLPPWVPARVSSALHRREVQHCAVRSVPGFTLLDAALRRMDSARALAWRLRQRVLLDALVATAVDDDVREIVAPSLSALRTFAAAPRAERILIEDLPGLRQLHADLDAAARALPEGRFLRNYRASDTHLVRQEQEYVLATRVKVRGRWAQQRAIRAGASRTNLEVLDLPAASRGPALRHDPSSRCVLLAGNTASRFGLEIALAALRELPELTLLCRPGEGSQSDGVKDPRVAFLDGSPLPPVRAVIAPSWVESLPPELTAAVDAGIPIIATSRALGWIEPSRRTVVEIPPGDARALAAALRILSAEPPAGSAGRGSWHGCSIDRPSQCRGRNGTDS